MDQGYLELNIGLRRPIRGEFIIVNVPYAILGADVICDNDLIPDLKRKCIIDTTTNLATDGRIVSVYYVAVQVVESKTPFAKLLSSFPALTRSSVLHKAKAVPNTQHVIETSGAPVVTKARRLLPDKLYAVKELFTKMLEQGVIRTSKSPWSSAISVAKFTVLAVNIQLFGGWCVIVACDLPPWHTKNVFTFHSRCRVRVKQYAWNLHQSCLTSRSTDFKKISQNR